MDLGKSRYGGPFTTEQVEDVKTFFKILVIFFPVFLMLCSFYPAFVTLLSGGQVTGCDTDNVAFSLMQNTVTIMVVSLLGYELVLYPFIRNWLPSILKRIEIISLLTFIFKVIELIMSTTFLFFPKYFSPWYNLIYSTPYCCLFIFLLNSLMEFVCAQSPYKMRGLLRGYVVFFFFLSLAISITAHFICHKYSCFVGIVESIFTALSLIGFILYCLLARWYKMRVRDEEYNIHRVVEEVYDRLLSQRQSI